MTTMVLLLIFVACTALLWFQGFWNSVVTVINLYLAALLATNFFEPLADWLDGLLPPYTYLWDFLLLWALFTFFFGIFRLITDLVCSRERIFFNLPVEMTGRSIFALWGAWVFVAFTCMTLHTAPLSAHPFSGSFQQEPKSGNFLGMAPDRQWLGLMQITSKGSLGWGQEFDPQAEFVIKYHHRRAVYEQESSPLVNRE